MITDSHYHLKLANKDLNKSLRDSKRDLKKNHLTINQAIKQGFKKSELLAWIESGKLPYILYDGEKYFTRIDLSNCL